MHQHGKSIIKLNYQNFNIIKKKIKNNSTKKLVQESWPPQKILSKFFE